VDLLDSCDSDTESCVSDDNSVVTDASELPTHVSIAYYILAPLPVLFCWLCTVSERAMYSCMCCVLMLTNVL
jgi:hypothetical protein